MPKEPDGTQHRWWVQDSPSTEPTTPEFRAVAYYRHSAQDRQENSVAIQQEQVQQWARENGVHIIHEFADRGKSGLTAEGRDGFNDMMEDWVKRHSDFDFVLCLDVSRWGRFQDIDLSATYSAECKRYGKQVIYTTLGKPKPGDQLYQVYVQFERLRAAQYSKELSDKVFRGCVKITEQGYWAGGKPPYGLQRLLLDEARKPVHTLAPGQRKSIQNQRVTLAPGDELQIATIQRIFREFTETLRSMQEIAESLNRDGITSPGGGTWDRSKVRRILLNELYVGTLVYNRTTQKRQDAHPTQSEGGVDQGGRRMPSRRRAGASDNRPTPTPTDDAQPPASPLRARVTSSQSCPIRKQWGRPVRSRLV